MERTDCGALVLFSPSSSLCLWEIHGQNRRRSVSLGKTNFSLDTNHPDWHQRALQAALLLQVQLLAREHLHETSLPKTVWCLCGVCLYLCPTMSVSDVVYRTIQTSVWMDLQQQGGLIWTFCWYCPIFRYEPITIYVAVLRRKCLRTQRAIPEDLAKLRHFLTWKKPVIKFALPKTTITILTDNYSILNQ